jgi:hypothetical protein
MYLSVFYTTMQPYIMSSSHFSHSPQPCLSLLSNRKGVMFCVCMYTPYLQDLLWKKNIAKYNKVNDKDYICDCSECGVIVTYARLLLPQANILSRKVEPTKLLGIRTILLVRQLLIYLKVIISKYLLQIYWRPQWNIALCNIKPTYYPWLHNKEELRTSTFSHIH